MSLPLEVSVGDVQRRFLAGEAIRIIDVREEFEHQLASIPAGQLIPMNSIPAALPELLPLSKNFLLVVVCHHGIRSLSVVNWLRAQGLADCQSMAGGIERWSLEIDPDVPRY